MFADEFLPVYDVSDEVATVVAAEPQVVWEALLGADLVEVGRPQVVALSGHDSTWTYGAFAHRFGDRYRTVWVGEPLRITAANG